MTRPRRATATVFTLYALAATIAALYLTLH